MGEAPSLARRVDMKDNSDQRDESGRLLTRRVEIGEESRKQNGDRKSDPIPVPCTPVYGCLKNPQIVAISRTPGRARNALRAAQLEPHIISPQADPIGQVSIRSNRKAWCDYPPRLSHDHFVPLFTYLPRNRSQHLCTPRERAGQPGPRAENREWGPMDARRPLAARDDVFDAIRHVSVRGIESCSDKLIHGDADAAQVHATARRLWTLVTLENTLCVFSLRPRRSRLGQRTRAAGHPSRATPPFGDGEFGAPKPSGRLRIFFQLVPLCHLEQAQNS